MQAEPTSPAPVEEIIRVRPPHRPRSTTPRPPSRSCSKRDREGDRGAARPLRRLPGRREAIRLAAIEQYRQALIWGPDDEAAREDRRRSTSTMAEERYRQAAVHGADGGTSEHRLEVGDRTDRAPRRARCSQATLADRIAQIRREPLLERGVAVPVLVDVDEPRLRRGSRRRRSASALSPPTLQAIGGLTPAVW